MTGVVTRKIQVKVKAQLIVPDVVIPNVNHGRHVLLKTQNALIAKRLDILHQFAFSETKVVLQKLRKAKGEEQEIALLRLVLLREVDVFESLQIRRN